MTWQQKLKNSIEALENIVEKNSWEVKQTGKPIDGELDQEIYHLNWSSKKRKQKKKWK